MYVDDPFCEGPVGRWRAFNKFDVSAASRAIAYDMQLWELGTKSRRGGAPQV